MMLSLLGSLLGFGTSFLPKVMEFFQDKQDKKHELMLLAAQADIQVKLEGVRLEAVNVDADIRESEALLIHDAKSREGASQWVVNMAASVRPIMTYLLFFEFLALSVAVFAGWISKEHYTMIWNNEMQAVWAAVVSFWFGARQFGRRNQT